jgi:hypothetical protein
VDRLQTGEPLTPRYELRVRGLLRQAARPEDSLERAAEAPGTLLSARRGKR